jgi:transcriptional regulator
MNQEEILQLTSKKHIKIWKLHKSGLKSKEIATLLGTNVGHVFNVLKDYNSKHEKVNAADLI